MHARIVEIIYSILIYMYIYIQLFENCTKSFIDEKIMDSRIHVTLTFVYYGLMFQNKICVVILIYLNHFY